MMLQMTRLISYVHNHSQLFYVNCMVSRPVFYEAALRRAHLQT